MNRRRVRSVICLAVSLAAVSLAIFLSCYFLAGSSSKAAADAVPCVDGAHGESGALSVSASSPGVVAEDEDEDDAEFTMSTGPMFSSRRFADDEDDWVFVEDEWSRSPFVALPEQAVTAASVGVSPAGAGSPEVAPVEAAAASEIVEDRVVGIHGIPFGQSRVEELCSLDEGPPGGDPEPDSVPATPTTAEPAVASHGDSVPPADLGVAEDNVVTTSPADKAAEENEAGELHPPDEQLEIHENHFGENVEDQLADAMSYSEGPHSCPETAGRPEVPEAVVSTPVSDADPSETAVGSEEPEPLEGDVARTLEIYATAASTPEAAKESNNDVSVPPCVATAVDPSEVASCSHEVPHPLACEDMAVALVPIAYGPLLPVKDALFTSSVENHPVMMMSKWMVDALQNVNRQTMLGSELPMPLDAFNVIFPPQVNEPRASESESSSESTEEYLMPAAELDVAGGAPTVEEEHGSTSAVGDTALITPVDAPSEASLSSEKGSEPGVREDPKGAEKPQPTAKRSAEKDDAPSPRSESGPVLAFLEWLVGILRREKVVLDKLRGDIQESDSSSSGVTPEPGVHPHCTTPEDDLSNDHRPTFRGATGTRPKSRRLRSVDSVSSASESIDVIDEHQDACAHPIYNERYDEAFSLQNGYHGMEGNTPRVFPPEYAVREHPSAGGGAFGYYSDAGHNRVETRNVGTQTAPSFAFDAPRLPPFYPRMYRNMVHVPHAHDYSRFMAGAYGQPNVCRSPSKENRRSYIGRCEDPAEVAYMPSEYDFRQAPAGPRLRSRVIHV